MLLSYKNKHCSVKPRKTLRVLKSKKPEEFFEQLKCARRN